MQKECAKITIDLTGLPTLRFAILAARRPIATSTHGLLDMTDNDGQQQQGSRGKPQSNRPDTPRTCVVLAQSAASLSSALAASMVIGMVDPRPVCKSPEA